MITVPLINWQPIANMPEDRKDGRCMLLWDFNGPIIVRWSEDDGGQWETGYFYEREDADGRLSYDKNAAFEPRYWADINPPA